MMPRGRRIALVLLTLAVASATGLALFGPRRAARLARAAWRLRRAKGDPYDLVVLARNGRGIGVVQGYLEERLKSKDNEVRRYALMGLARSFPQSRAGRAVREYAEIAGEYRFSGDWSGTLGHFNGRGARKEIPLDEAIARWKALVETYPDFPGRDDAGLRLARCQEEAGRARDALLTLIAARQWGDRDKKFVIEDRIANVLDAQLSLEDTLDLAKTGRPRGLLAYAAAVKLARAHRFAEAVEWAERADELFAEGETDLIGHAPRYFVWRTEDGREVAHVGLLREDVKDQKTLWKKLARTSDLLALAERVRGEPHAFENLVLHQRVKSDRSGAKAGDYSEDAVFAAYCRERNHLAQSAALCEAVARVDSSRRTRALLGAAVARIGLAGYWGAAAGHAVCDSQQVLIDDAAAAMRAVLRACTAGELPAVAGTLQAAQANAGFDTRVMWPRALSGKALRRTLNDRARPARASHPPAEEGERGR